jgi:mannan endo-1,4-beta-mannosidase
VRDVAKADNIIIAEGAFGGQDSGNWNDGLVADANSAILSLSKDLLAFNGKTYKNIVFSIHTYDQWNFGDAKLADYFDRVQKKNLAMIVGEYGVQTNADTTAAFDSTLNTAVPRHIGRIAWHWDGSDGNKLTTANPGGGWQIDDCSNPTNLSYMGQKIWDDNHTP